MKEKILTFKNDTDMYVKLAQERAEKEDYTGALGFLFSALKNKDDTEVLGDIADVYADMGLYELSNGYWYRYLDKAPKENLGVCYEELVMNYVYLENIKLATHYLNKKLMLENSIESGGFEEQMANFLKDKKADRSEYRIVYPFDRADFSENIRKAKGFLIAGDLDAALKEYALIPESSPQGKSVLAEKSLATFLKGDIDKGIELSFLDLKENGASVSCYCNLSSMYNSLKNEDKSEYYYKKALEIAPTDIEDCFKLSTCCLEHSDHKNVLKYVKKIIEERPYEPTMRLFYALALINVGDYEKSKDFLSESLRINPFDLIAKYYYSLADDLCAGDAKKQKFLPLKYDMNLPKQEIKSRAAIIKNIANNPLKWSDVYKNQTLKDIFTWGIKYGREEIKDDCLYAINANHDRKSFNFCLELLLDNEIDDMAKRMMLFYLVMKGYKKRFSFLASGVFVKIKPLKLKCESDVSGKKFLYGYAMALSYLALIDMPVSSKLAESADRLYTSLKSQNLEDFSEKDITALIVSESDIKIISEDETCRVFGADKNKLSKLKNFIKG